MTAAPRVEPVAPPYPPELQKVFDSIMPPTASAATVTTRFSIVTSCTLIRFRLGHVCLSAHHAPRR